MKDPAFLFYPSIFLSDTYTMTDDQVGKMIRLWCMQHLKGGIAKSQMTKISGDDPEILAEFEKDANGNYFNRHLMEIISKRKRFSEKQAENGKKGGRPPNPNGNPKETQKKPKDKPNETPIINTNTNTNINTDENENTTKDVEVSDVFVTPTFDEFWMLYDKKQDRKKSEQAWSKIPQDEREAIMDHIPKYKLSQPEKSYRKNPLTYLNGENWRDEVVISDKQLENSFYDSLHVTN